MTSFGVNMHSVVKGCDTYLLLCEALNWGGAKSGEVSFQVNLTDIRR